MACHRSGKMLSWHCFELCQVAALVVVKDLFSARGIHSASLDLAEEVLVVARRMADLLQIFVISAMGYHHPAVFARGWD